MKTLYLDCGMGAAGDMLMGALLELHPEPEIFLARLNGLGIPHVRVEAQRVERCGVGATHMRVMVQGEEEESLAHGPNGGHGHGHTHGSLMDIREIIRSLPLSAQVQENALAVYESIAAAEAEVHGRPVEQVHFHEVGALDAVADVVGVCMLMEELRPDRIMASALRLGYGQVRCAHGILPVPAPATAILLKGIPVYAGDMQGEMCTPTGAALVARFAGSFGPMPLMRLQKAGNGAGSRELPAANLLRALWGEEEGESERVAELCCNVDDMSGEALAFACEALLEAGALDVFLTPVQMKKGRPGHLLTCLCAPGQEAVMAPLILRHTSTLGVRGAQRSRYVLERREEKVQSPYGPVGRKMSQGYGAKKKKYEYEDVAALARKLGLSYQEMLERLP